MTRSKVTVTRMQGRLGRRAANTDGVIGLVMGGVAVSGGVQLGEVNVLHSLADLEALLVTAAYDSTNKTLVYHHIERLYGRNSQAEIHLMLVARTVTMAQMCDKANDYAAKISKDSNGRVKLIGAILNPTDEYTPALSGGLDADVIAAIAKAQELATEEALRGREISFVLEGREYNGTAGAADDLRTKNAPNVSVVIAADNDVSEAEAEYETYAAVGDFLGMLSKAAVSQNCGELTEAFNLQNVARGWFINPGLSNGGLLTTQTDGTLDTLDTKGFIFAETPASFAGVFFSDTHTCVAIENDYFSIEANRTIDKMKRLARVALLPRVKSRFLVDEETGELDETAKANLEDTAVGAISVMVTDGDLSGGVDAYIPPTNLLGGDPIVIEITAVPVAIGREIKVNVGFNNPFGNNN
ncbi:MAG: DUF2586 family protein [Bacteroidetes bacterium]|nr:DUF2586 family protein [Bacteroidota bacterium]